MAQRHEYMARPADHPDPGGAQARGWGSGYPHCQDALMVRVRRGRVRISVRREIAELVATLLEATEQGHGYRIKPAETGGFNCRAIGHGNSPSNHSWGLAVDLNWNDNPWQEPFQSDLPPAVVPMWWACGFYWGGWYSGKPDPMHFEYVYRPDQVAGHLATAKEYLMAFRDDDDARALIYRVDGLLSMRESIDTHVHPDPEPNELARVIRAIAGDAAAARTAAEQALAVASAARQAAERPGLDEQTLAAVVERVVRQVLAERGAEPPDPAA